MSAVIKPASCQRNPSDHALFHAFTVVFLFCSFCISLHQLFPADGSIAILVLQPQNATIPSELPTFNLQLINMHLVQTEADLRYVA